MKKTWAMFPYVLRLPLVQVIVQVILCTGMAIILAWATHRLEELQEQLALWKFWYLPFGVALGALTYVWSIWVAGLLIEDDARPQSAHSTLITVLMKSPWLFSLLALPGFGEELLFRGFIQPLVIEILSEWAIFRPAMSGIILTALLFGFMHRDRAGSFWTRNHMVRLLALSVASATWGWAAYSSGSLCPAILAHAGQGFIVGWRGHIHLNEKEREDGEA